MARFFTSILLLCAVFVCQIPEIACHQVPNPTFSVLDESGRPNPLNKYKPINGAKIGKPVRYMDTYGTGTTQYLTQYTYGDNECGGDPVEVASISTDICYEASYKYLYVEDDAVHYYFYFYYFDGQEGGTTPQDESATSPFRTSESQVSRKKPELLPGNLGKLRKKGLKPEYYHYEYFYSVLYTVVTSVVDDVTVYSLNTTWFMNTDCTGTSVSTVTSGEGECTIPSTYGDGPFYYGPHANGGSQYFELSATQFTPPNLQGVLTSYYAYYYACEYYSDNAPAPYVVWVPLNQCMEYESYYSEQYLTCSGGYLYYDFYYYSTTCSTSYYYSYEGSIYLSSCNYYYSNTYEAISYTTCTDGPTSMPTLAPSNYPTRKPSARPSSAPKAPSSKPTLRPTNAPVKPTRAPTKQSIVQAQFTANQILSNVSAFDMESYQAVSAFSAAVISALDSSYVLSVDVTSITSDAEDARNAEGADADAEEWRMLLGTSSPTSSPTSTHVTYSVLFSCTKQQVSNVYYELSTALAYAVAYGYFQTDLYNAAALQNPVPTSLLYCSATEPPSTSTYTITESDDDFDDSIYLDDAIFFDDIFNDDFYDDDSKANNHVLSTGAVVGISIACVAVVAMIIAGLVFFFYFRSNKSAAGYNSGQATSFAKMENMNPTFAGGGGGGPVVASAVEMSAPPTRESQETFSPLAAGGGGGSGEGGGSNMINKSQPQPAPVAVAITGVPIIRAINPPPGAMALPMPPAVSTTPATSTSPSSVLVSPSAPPLPMAVDQGVSDDADAAAVV